MHFSYCPHCGQKLIKKEIGQQVESLKFIKSYPYEKKEMLMLGFQAKVKKQLLVLSREVDDAVWVKYADALSLLREGSIAWQLVRQVLENEKRDEAMKLEA